MLRPGQENPQQSFLIAISSDEGKTWTFVDGQGISKENLHEIIPDFPPGLALPPKSAPIIEPSAK